MRLSTTLLWLACALSACKGRAPALELECAVHQDCTLTSLGSNCCDGCGARLGNQRSVAAFLAWCERQPPRSCPKLDCPNTAQTAFCEDGRCLARQGVHAQ